MTVRRGLAVVWLAVIAGTMAVCLLWPSQAHAWEMVKTTNGVLVTRDPSVDATAQVYVNVYYDYKGGGVWNNTYPPRQYGSYNSFVQYSSVFGGAGAAPNEAEVPLVPNGGRFQLVTVGTLNGPGYTVFPVLYEPLSVSVANTPTVDVRTMPSVGTVSLEDSATVGVRTVGPWDSASLGYLLAAAALYLGIGVGRWAARDS